MGCDWLILGISGHNWRQPTLVNKAKFRRRWPTSWLGSLGRSLEEFNQFHHHKSPINPSGLLLKGLTLQLSPFTSKFQIGLVDFTFQLSPTNPSCSWFNHIKTNIFDGYFQPRSKAIAWHLALGGGRDWRGIFGQDCDDERRGKTGGFQCSMGISGHILWGYSLT